MGFIVNSQVPINVAFLPVGSPTITDGVVTDFSPSDYVQTNQIPDLTGTFDLRVCGSINYSPISNDYWLPILVGSGNSVGIGTDRYAYLWVTGTSTNSIANQLKGNKQYELNKEYIWSWKHTAGNYSLLYSEDNGQTWNTDVSISSNEDITQQSKLRIGAPVIDKPYQYWRGYIDLNKCYLEINGQEWKYIPGSVQPQNIVIDDGTNQTSANYLIVDDKLVWANPNLFLDNTSNTSAYIDTGIPGSYFNGKSILAHIKYYGTSDRNAFGLLDTTNGSRLENGIGWSGTSFSANFGNVGLGDAGYISFDKTEIYYTPTNGYINGVNVLNWTAYSGSKSSWGVFSQNTTRTAYLLASNRQAGFRAFGGRLYYFTIFDENDKEVYKFVPVPEGMTIGSYTTPSAGMFDIVNQQFYANAGSGTFTWGKDE